MTRTNPSQENSIFYRMPLQDPDSNQEKPKMANLFDGPSDSRQSETIDEPLSRFRPKYRALDDNEKELHDKIKASFVEVEKLIETLNPGRYRSLALTSLEESCMWAIKELTGPKT